MSTVLIVGGVVLALLLVLGVALIGGGAAFLLMKRKGTPPPAAEVEPVEPTPSPSTPAKAAPPPKKEAAPADGTELFENVRDIFDRIDEDEDHTMMLSDTQRAALQGKPTKKRQVADFVIDD